MTALAQHLEFAPPPPRDGVRSFGLAVLVHLLLVQLVLVELSGGAGQRRLLRRPPADLSDALVRLRRGPEQPQP